MANLHPGNSWSTRWHPPSEQRARRQFELVNGTDRGDRPGRPVGIHAHGHGQFRPPLAMGSAPRTGGYHLNYNAEGLTAAHPISFKKRRVGPEDVGDSFAQCDFDVEMSEPLPECLGDPREYVDEMGDFLEDQGKHKQPMHPVRFASYYHFKLLLTRLDRMTGCQHFWHCEMSFSQNHCDCMGWDTQLTSKSALLARRS